MEHAMGPGDRGLTSVVALHPLLAFALLIVGIAMAGLVGSLVPPDASFGAANAVFVFFLTGWPTLVSLHLSRVFGGAARVNSTLVIASFAYVVVANFFVVSILNNLPSGSWPLTLVSAVAWGLGLLCPLYMMWSAARALTSVEEGKQVPANRYIGTFALFFFLPVGIFFIQQRLRKVLSGPGLRPSET